MMPCKQKWPWRLPLSYHAEHLDPEVTAVRGHDSQHTAASIHALTAFCIWAAALGGRKENPAAASQKSLKSQMSQETS